MFQATPSTRPAQPVVRLHLGAHKTATTWIQRALALNAETLATRGAVPLDPPVLRSIPPGLLEPKSADPLSRILKRRAARRELERAIEESGGLSAETLIISEENVIGNSGQIIRNKRLYPAIKTRLAALPRLFQGPDATIFFAVREYGGFFASCHSQMARRQRADPLPRLDHGGFLLLPQRWPGIVRAIRAAFPNARLVVWRYEDFEALATQILTLMTGLREEEIRRPEGRPLPALSQAAMLRIMQEEAETGDAVGEHTLKRIVREMSVEAGYARYAPWSEEESLMFRFAYAQDWSAIRTMPDVRVFEA